MIKEKQSKMLTLTQALVEERKKQGLTQDEVAARMGIARTYVTRVEGEARDTRIGTLEKYARALGKDLAWHFVDIAD